MHGPKAILDRRNTQDICEGVIIQVDHAIQLECFGRNVKRQLLVRDCPDNAAILNTHECCAWLSFRFHVVDQLGFMIDYFEFMI